MCDSDLLTRTEIWILWYYSMKSLHPYREEMYTQYSNLAFRLLCKKGYAVAISAVNSLKNNSLSKFSELQ